MPLLITLRRDLNSSPFRRQLERLCAAPGGADMVLCSGYIWEPDYGYSVLSDDLLRVIAEGIGTNQVMTIAGKFDSRGPINWLQHYRNFCARLKEAGVRVSAVVAPTRNWHAKIAMRMDATGSPLAAIVGSSNLTGPAYGEGRESWNYECDVTIWRDER
jgi:hypothetical protein